MGAASNILRMRILRGILLVALGGVCWAFSGTCAQLLTGSYGLDPGWIISVRVPCAAVLFLILAIAREREHLVGALRDKRTMLGMVFFALFGILLTQYGYITAISLTNAGTGTVMERFGLVLLTVLVCITSRRLPHAREVVGVLLAIAGTVLIATKGNLGVLAIPPEALFWGFMLACGFVGYTLLPEKMLQRWGSIVVTALGMSVAGMVVLAVERPWTVAVQLSPAMVAALAAMVVLGTFFAYLLFLQGVKECGSMRAGMVGCIEPVAATVISALWLGSPVTWADIAGMALILSMVVLVTLQPKGKGRPEEIKEGGSGVPQNQGS